MVLQGAVFQPFLKLIKEPWLLERMKGSTHSDWGDIGMVVRRSDDNGKTWEIEECHLYKCSDNEKLKIMAISV